MKFLQLLLFVSAALCCHAGMARADETDATPRVFILDAKRLSTVRQRLGQGDKTFDAALQALKTEAEKAMKAGPFAVTQKGVLPPSGDKHDYLSQGIYWWPNPNTPNGLPYVRRDGQINPETKKITDERHMYNMSHAVYTLAQSFFFTGNEEHAARAALLLKTWFLDEATRMNPHLQYAQFTPGRSPHGRYSGIVDTEALVKIPDAVGMLHGAKAWTSEDERGLRAWFGKYADWLETSEFGKKESAEKNNHGTGYDAQVAVFALFSEQRERAEKVLREVATKRIAAQIEPDGRQPAELVRTKAWTYSQKNLQTLFWLAAMSEKVGVDLWNYETPDGRSIRKALDYLIPFATGEEAWTYPKIDIKAGDKPRLLTLFLSRAAVKYNEPRYAALLQQLAPDYASSVSALLWLVQAE